MSVSAVTIVPLVPNLPLPQQATARTRSPIPPGYGVQEQCVPFTAASALGFLIGSPIRFGLCRPEEAPEGCRLFRSPFDQAREDGSFAEARVFYVFDRPECKFFGNAYQLENIPVDGTPALIEPGVSFFDRPDQQHLFKLHLPYIWRTAQSVDTLFLPLLNRPSKGFEVQSGLVETDWYPSPVNLILGKQTGSIHVLAGDPVAHAILVSRQFRGVALEIAAPHSRLNRETRKGLAQWDKQHAQDRSIYKILARGTQERRES